MTIAQGNPKAVELSRLTCPWSMYCFSHLNPPFIASVMEMDPVTISPLPAGSMSSLSVEGAGRTLRGRDFSSQLRHGLWTCSGSGLCLQSHSAGHAGHCSFSWQTFRQLFNEFLLCYLLKTIPLTPQRTDSQQVSGAQHLKNLFFYTLSHTCAFSNWIWFQPWG